MPGQDYAIYVDVGQYGISKVEVDPVERMRHMEDFMKERGAVRLRFTIIFPSRAGWRCRYWLCPAPPLFHPYGKVMFLARANTSGSMIRYHGLQVCVVCVRFRARARAYWCVCTRVCGLFSVQIGVSPLRVVIMNRIVWAW